MDTPLRAASLRAVGSTGVVEYGGVIYSDDQDKAWRGSSRDRTIVAMLNDPVIGAVLYAMEMWLRRVAWRVKPSDEDNPQAVEYADYVTSCLEDMDGTWPGDSLSDLLTYMSWGYSVSEIVYKQRVGPWERDPSRKSRHSDGLIGWRKWMLLPQTTREGWAFDRGEPATFVQRQQVGAPLQVPLDKCIHIKYQSGSGSPEGKTPLRHAYDAWYYKRNIQRIEAIGIERDLAGLPMMKIPSRDIEDGTDTYTAAKDMVTAIRNDSMSGVVIASDVDEQGNALQTLELLSSGGTRQFDTDVIIRRYANEVVNAFLASVLRSGQDGIGTQALSTTMSDLFVTSLSAHLDIVQTAINEQAILPLCMVNGFNLDLLPTIEHGDIESADIARTGAYLAQLSNAGLLVDSPALRQFVHDLAELPVPDEAQLETDMAAQRADQIAQQEAANEARMAQLQQARGAQNGAPVNG